MQNIKSRTPISQKHNPSLVSSLPRRSKISAHLLHLLCIALTITRVSSTCHSLLLAISRCTATGSAAARARRGGVVTAAECRTNRRRGVAGTRGGRGVGGRVVGVVRDAGAREHTVLVERAHLATLGCGRLGRTLRVVVKAGQDVSRGRRLKILCLFLLNALFALNLWAIGRDVSILYMGW